ncbi:RNA polymerase sigma factor [Actinokineospora diospyrosa]|uniref:RNA polymerase sigma-70 factor, ECF subfamily n=1 Tax=Actinokineospora diospyrosa TaxID=103728 RepID=A0ABT1ID18_9PSEU|nr:sigma-70 family RNA polymerase sigma factor [Actinokineospora diospyrosa]MCP2270241.1 RNA polymerase sigma-70 factor, ECF subfamily [Actinokineospora diospyrosa]
MFGLLDGDFAAFHDRHRANFVKFVELRGLTRQDAEDVVGDAFVALYRNRSTLRAAASQEALAFKVLRDSLADFWRRRTRRPEAMGDDLDGLVAQDDVAGLVARMDLERALATLPTRQAECLALYALLGQDTADIGRYLGISESAVRSHLSYARQRLERLDNGSQQEER